MAYEKTFWKDRIRDSQGNIIQEGTPVSAGHLNNMENGIAAAHDQLAEQARETVSLPYGLSALNSPDGSPLDVEIQGKTLISLGNSPLEGGKKYVLSDPQYAVIVDGTTYQGVAKFEGKDTKPTIIRTANFKDKVSGNTQGNPHMFKWLSLGMSELAPPNHPNFQELTEGDAWNGYGNVAKLDEKLVNAGGRTGNNEIAQHLFPFNLLAEVERKIGVIPKNTLSDKIQWLKDNVEEVSFNWWGYGSSPKGYRADIVPWNDVLSSWTTPWSGHLASETAKMPVILYGINLTSGINSEGIIYFLAYSEASDGVTSSIINTNYVDFDIKLKASATFRTSRIPLYEVSQTEYDKILVDWDATSVTNRYPAVEGIQSLQNPIVTVEGENLLPPLSEWALHPSQTSKVTGSYELELNATDRDQFTEIIIPLLPNQKYFYSGKLEPNIDIAMPFRVHIYLEGDILYNAAPITGGFTTPSNAKYASVRITNDITVPNSKVIFSDPMLTLGDDQKEFVSRNPSYLYTETTLRGFNDVNDLLYQTDGRWKVLINCKEDTLDGSKSWDFAANHQGYKTVRSTVSNEKKDTEIVINPFGKKINHVYPDFDEDQSYMSGGLLYLTLSDLDTGFNSTYTPTGLEVAAYFNGWKVKTVDESNKPTGWISVIDGTDAPTQTLDYVKANKAPGYTGYRLFYQLATPKVVDITDKVEGALSVSGSVQISVDSGVGVREKVIPKTDDLGKYRINSKYLQDSTLANRASEILSITKNNIDTTKEWDISYSTDGGNANGKVWAQISADKFDATANYYVTYLVQEKETFTANPVNVLATYNTSIRSTVNQMNEQLADVKALTSVQERYLYKLLLAAKANGWSV